MNCNVCGAEMRPFITDLPFKVGETAIVILKELPVLQCGNCREYLIEDKVMERVEAILTNANTSAELEIVKYAA
ncbi:MAG: type II toxin-antitoxin system MqsA family antitoxin [bacterium]